ncbi:MAG: hypothetical protein ROR55_22050 [Devosia sp.]
MAFTLNPGAMMVFIVYNTNADAVARGYEPWLRETDCPFFNSIPGIAYYANWKMDAPSPFAYFDFLIIEGDDRLKDVWFNKDLDHFRTEWVRLWGYGDAPLPMHRYSHVTRVERANFGLEVDEGWLTLGKGDPSSDLPTVARVEGSLAKHFAGSQEPWFAPVEDRQPLGYDYVGFSPEKPAEGDLILPTHAVARP